MMKKMNKTDRYILIVSMGVLLISASITFDKVFKQKLKKEHIQLTQQETLRKEILNIKTWRGYHTEQMMLMQAILKELKYLNLNNDSVPMPQQPLSRVSSHTLPVQ